PTFSTRPTFVLGPANTRGSSHEKPGSFPARAAAHPGGREFAGARLPRGRRHAAVLRARRGRLSLGRGRAPLYRLPRVVGTHGCGTHPPCGGRGGAGGGLPGALLRCADGGRNRAGGAPVPAGSRRGDGAL